MLDLDSSEQWSSDAVTREIRAVGRLASGAPVGCRVTFEALSDWFGCAATPEACLLAARHDATTLVEAWRLRALLRAFEADGTLLIA